ncbi:MAG: GntR family transcriptional regulator [Anaerohalosphaeraceae bacterium]|nr:GntR family transcriptional regulator [Anaerohalosphaeraceae bacterium]
MLEDKSPSKPVYAHIKDKIQKMIQAEGLASGDFLPPVRELASKFGTTTVTVSRATRELAYEGKLLRLPRKGVIVSPHFDNRVNEKSWALVFPGNGYSYPQFAKAIRNEAEKKGISADIIFSFGEPEKERKSVIEAIKNGVSAVLLMPVYPSSKNMIIQNLNYLADLPVPVVVMDYWEPEKPISGVDFVMSDNFSGGYQATLHLIRHGYKKISIVNTPSETKQLFTERQKGYETAMADYGLEVLDLPKITSEHLEHKIFDSIERHITAGVEAFFVTNDYSATMLLSSLRKMNVRVPDDVALIGYDNAPFSSISQPRLTTIRPNVLQIVQKAFEVLCHRMEHKTRGNHRIILIRPEIVCRESCGKNCHMR